MLAAVARRLSSPVLIGRSAEVAELDAVLAEVAGGSPATVLIRGEAGVGKTRLLRELIARAEARDARVLAGGCAPLGAGAIPLLPVAEALLAFSAQEPAALDDVAPEVAALLPDGEPAPAAGSSVRLHAGVLALLTRLGRERPVVLAVEDVHWADASTLGLLAFLR